MKTDDQISDTALIEKLLDRRTEEDGIRYLYKVHFETLKWFIRRNSGSDEDAQDIFQEVVVSFVHLVKQNRFKRESSIGTFLFSMNRNIWLNELKRRGRSKEREKNYDQMLEQQEVQMESQLDNREASEQLLGIMDRLGENCKKILLLFYYENLSFREMLIELDYENEQVLRNKKYKCLKKLEEMVHAEKTLLQRLKSLLHG